MPLWALIVWLIIGGLAGMTAGKIMDGKPPYGMVGDIVLGIAGGVVGGWVLGLFGMSGSGGIIGSFLIALLGAVIILWLVRKFKKV